VIPVPARYLVRFDDICPGMRWSVWREIEKILVDNDVRPMLAVVPQNEDPTLDVDAREPRFWELVRGWQARGWTIGLHGYQHRYVTRAAGLVGLNQRSEFAGLPYAEQLAKLRRAVDIFGAESVRPDVWIAPGHSFDATTVAALGDVGIRAISDGFFVSSHRDERGTLWVPQQLWSFRYRPCGDWTVCYHHNDWAARDVTRFAADVAKYRSRITSFGEIAAAPTLRKRTWHDDLFAKSLLSIINTKTWLKRRVRRSGADAPA
jgi:predicted deacetylase